MAAHALLVVLLAFSPAAPPVETERSGRTPHELRTAVHETMRRQATASGAAHQAATRELVSLYHELAASTRLTDGDKREQMAYVRNRLRRTSQALERQQARDDAPAAEAPPPLARQQPAAQALLAQKPGNPPAAQAAPRQPLFPAAGAAPSAGGGQSLAAMTNQNAQELIDLIQDTIAPHTWDVRGGHGVIRYFAPSQVLVIRQSGDVHGQVGAAIQGLRKAGN
jgi:hypothetical protein